MLPQIVLAVHAFAPDARIQSGRVTGNTAIVQFSGATIEGAKARGRLLLRKYPFGWQAVDMALNDDAFRRQDLRDSGANADVIAIRGLMQNRFHSHQIIGPVRVVQNYALVGWWGWGGGETLFRKAGHHWSIVTSGGGVLDAAGLRRYGVPAPIASEIFHEQKQF